jgi:hypothetical protein
MVKTWAKTGVKLAQPGLEIDWKTLYAQDTVHSLRRKYLVLCLRTF